VTSPDGKLALAFACENGRVTYSLRADGKRLIQDSPVGYEGGTLAGVKPRSVDAVWKPVWGKRAAVPERFNEVTLDLTTYRLVARAYDDGVAFRCLGGAGAERTQFAFAGDFTAWFYNGEHHNLGPEKLSESDGKRLPPMTVKAAEDAYLAVLEAVLGAGDPLALQTRKGETAFSVASKPSEAWRVLLFGRTPGAMVDSHLVELLNPPPQAANPEGEA
jgi:alpha-glucosidase